MVITVDFKRVSKDEISANYKFKPRFDEDRCECFLAMVYQMPILMEKMFRSIDLGARWLVENKHVDHEKMRQLLEQSAVSSIEEIGKFRNLVMVDD